MFKLLFTLAAFLLMGLCLLGLRQHRLEVTSKSAQLHRTILEREHTLWDQEVQITAKTNPMTLAAGLKASGMDLGDNFSQGAPSTRARSRTNPDGDTDLIRRLRHPGQ